MCVRFSQLPKIWHPFYEWKTAVLFTQQSPDSYHDWWALLYFISKCDKCVFFLFLMIWYDNILIFRALCVSIDLILHQVFFWLILFYIHWCGFGSGSGSGWVQISSVLISLVLVGRSQNEAFPDFWLIFAKNLSKMPESAIFGDIQV